MCKNTQYVVKKKVFDIHVEFMISFNSNFSESTFRSFRLPTIYLPALLSFINFEISLYDYFKYDFYTSKLYHSLRLNLKIIRKYFFESTIEVDSKSFFENSSHAFFSKFKIENHNSWNKLVRTEFTFYMTPATWHDSHFSHHPR